MKIKPHERIRMVIGNYRNFAKLKDSASIFQLYGALFKALSNTILIVSISHTKYEYSKETYTHILYEHFQTEFLLLHQVHGNHLNNSLFFV